MYVVVSRSLLPGSFILFSEFQLGILKGHQELGKLIHVLAKACGPFFLICIKKLCKIPFSLTKASRTKHTNLMIDLGPKQTKRPSICLFVVDKRLVVVRNPSQVDCHWSARLLQYGPVSSFRLVNNSYSDEGPMQTTSYRYKFVQILIKFLPGI